MQQVVEKVKRTPIDLRVLRKLIPKKCKAVVYTDLDKPRREVFKGVEGLVVLIPHKVSPIGHFVTLIPRKHHIEYNSSLGGSPDEELDKLHQSHAIMTKLLGKDFIYNSIKLQSGKYDIRDCASFVLMRLYFRKLKLREYQKLFAKQITLSNPDDIASLVTALLLM
jgi:hypothetical protein